jgi:hypothetical protein
VRFFDIVVKTLVVVYKFYLVDSIWTALCYRLKGRCDS